MRLPLSDLSTIVMQLAVQEAERVQSPHVAPEHILLAIAKYGRTNASKLLAEKGVGLREIRINCIERPPSEEPVKGLKGYKLDDKWTFRVSPTDPNYVEGPASGNSPQRRKDSNIPVFSFGILDLIELQKELDTNLAAAANEQANIVSVLQSDIDLPNLPTIIDGNSAGNE